MSSQAIYWIFSLAATERGLPAPSLPAPSTLSFLFPLFILVFSLSSSSCWSILWHFWVNINKFLIHMIKCVEWWLKLGFDSTPIHGVGESFDTHLWANAAAPIAACSERERDRVLVRCRAAIWFHTLNSIRILALCALYLPLSRLPSFSPLLCLPILPALFAFCHLPLCQGQ